MDASTDLTESESNLQLHLDTSHDENDVSLTNDPKLESTLANIEKGTDRKNVCRWSERRGLMRTFAGSSISNTCPVKSGRRI